MAYEISLKSDTLEELDIMRGWISPPHAVQVSVTEDDVARAADLIRAANSASMAKIEPAPTEIEKPKRGRKAAEKTVIQTPTTKPEEEPAVEEAEEPTVEEIAAANAAAVVTEEEDPNRSDLGTEPELEEEGLVEGSGDTSSDESDDDKLVRIRNWLAELTHPDKSPVARDAARIARDGLMKFGAKSLTGVKDAGKLDDLEAFIKAGLKEVEG